MSWKKIKSIAKRVLPPVHMNRKQFKKLRSHIGLTSKNKLARRLRRQFLGSDVSFGSSGAPTSAANFQSRTLSQLTGGV